MNDILATFFLVFCRISSFMVISPGFSLKQAPNLLKGLLSLSFSVTVFSSLQKIVVFQNLFIFSLQSFKEILVGMALGFIVQLVFSAIEMAGQIIDFQVGFSMGSVYDPGVGIQGSNYGRLYYWLALAVFFFTDMHHLVIDNLIQSFSIIPITEMSMHGNTVEGMMILFVEVFKISILLAAPVVLVALVTDCVLGIISRSVPQINVLMLGMPMKILISFFFVLLFMPNLIESIQKVLPDISRYLNEFMESLVR
ncbi:flagellar biosynthetic protein FliR [Vagococcus fluvialis]|jgi:flagellar biosynthetic protein FliR|uniref:flagellar biosynthetic protein FliR n=1 Tax=Vagococcus fluvialis TaxID=2738 RepID=UPI000A336504|nr:flagellar biosynthetic protein FliR [Vagococcus fluvialis]MDR2278757.1 flagellar biosynthetic protein FliR [Vagococcus sp.]OTP29635.1 flagellar biosynthetic protein FliR [Enterococcus sp. 6C8_DIV0013]MBO0419203.1 flagellar biosynthetic protein FliR [Vagococcus fluvialis]MBO0429043.1 flagellar biosynthetic protein FliR [Vagococcus fluvialis]MBO0443389.1 flagellar biosynthetic protein FliR [Vagococcus fluvialis]